MKRYIFSADTALLNKEYFDVLVVGSGIAGLYAALNIDENKKCAIVTKANIDQSNSYLAQGGIAAVISPDDYFASHVADTLKAGAGMCDEAAVNLLVTEGPKDIKILEQWQVPFDHNPEGELAITREGGHSRRRIVHCGGDATGKETTKRLGELVLQKKNITPFFETYLVDILTDENGVVGAVIFDGNEYKQIVCANIIICTGGIGNIYNRTTNPKGAIGDGIAAAYRAGTVIRDMEMVQFHPTTLISEENGRKFLISEAVRGEGGILRNREGVAFMENEHPLKDLAPRDIVTRCILKELKRSGDDRVFLDISSMSEEFFSKRFPTIYSQCKKQGIDVPRQWIPVCPSQHYLMGGIKTDFDGSSNIKGLYACGEAASTGIHGANRLASNSMLECLVFGRRCAEHINKNFRKAAENCGISVENDGIELDNVAISAKKQEIKDLVSKFAGPVRNMEGLNTAAMKISEILVSVEKIKAVSIEAFELYNMATVAYLIINGAKNRKESIGAHYLVQEEIV